MYCFEPLPSDVSCTQQSTQIERTKHTIAGSSSLEWSLKACSVSVLPCRLGQTRISLILSLAHWCVPLCAYLLFFHPLCHCSPSSTAASSPVINILTLSRYITPGINHRFPWRWNHPCRCVCLCDSSSVHVFVCLLYADCTCSPPVRAVSAGDAAALAFRLAVTAV